MFRSENKEGVVCMVISVSRRIIVPTNVYDKYENGKDILLLKKEGIKDCLFRGDLILMREKKFPFPREKEFEITAIGLVEKPDGTYFKCRITPIAE